MKKYAICNACKLIINCSIFSLHLFTYKFDKYITIIYEKLFKFVNTITIEFIVFVLRILHYFTIRIIVLKIYCYIREI